MTLTQPSTIETLATACFAVAVLHTFATKYFAELSHRYPPGSVGENFFHFLSEVEVVFGFWAFLFIICYSAIDSTDAAAKYLEGVKFTEAAFVFVIMAMASTKPVMETTSVAMSMIARLAPAKYRTLTWYVICLILGPLLGSFITEPAAMTVTALLLSPLVFHTRASSRLRYSTLAVLFVNVSIGGTLTHFAAPPVVMVADAWGWNSGFMFRHFGWKSAVAVVINTVLVAGYNFDEISREKISLRLKRSMPTWVVVVQFVFLALVVRYHASMTFFGPLFLIFLGWHEVTMGYQDGLKLRESLLVGFFLGGLVTLGQLQSWWISPLLTSLSPFALFAGATGLTGFTDNAALTYLGTLVPNLGDVSKYSLVAGALCGGGLTVIANAPNPIGLGLVKQSFGEGSVSAGKLFVYALIPTLIACLALWIL